MPHATTPLAERAPAREVSPPPRYRLDEASTVQLTDAARSLCTGDDRLNDPSWLGRLRSTGVALPTGARRFLSAFGYDSGATGTMVLSGVPTDPDPSPTPTVVGSVRCTPTVSSVALLLLAQGLGHPVAYLKEKSGALVQDVVPVRGLESEQSNAGAVELLMHTENAFHRYRPDYVLLLCVRADPAGQAGLRVASVRQAMPLLDGTTITTLCEPRFRTSPPPSFGDLNELQVGPVLRGTPEDPDLCVDFAATQADDERAAEALRRLNTAIQDVTHEIRLQTGEMVVVDNRIAVHGRTAYRPRFDGTDRWLHRAFVQVDFRRSRHLRPDNGHVLDGRQ